MAVQAVNSLAHLQALPQAALRTTASPNTHICHSLPPGLSHEPCAHLGNLQPWYPSHSAWQPLWSYSFSILPLLLPVLVPGLQLAGGCYQPFPLVQNEDTFPTGLSHPAEGCTDSMVIQVDNYNEDIYVTQRHLSNHQSQMRLNPSESLNFWVKMCFLKAKASTEYIQPQGPGLCSASLKQSFVNHNLKSSSNGF